jgi:large subunit ribosomal protein L10
MNKEQKKIAAEELKDAFKKAKAVFLADYKGINVENLTSLRKQLRPLNTKVKVIKNNIARVAVKEAQIGEEAVKVFDTVVGPTIVMVAFNDPAAVAKVVNKFSQDNEVFSLKDGLLDNKRLSTNDIAELAKLPSKEVMLAKLLGTLNAPISNFVGVLAAVPRSFVQVLAAIEKKKQG